MMQSEQDLRDTVSDPVGAWGGAYLPPLGPVKISHKKDCC